MADISQEIAAFQNAVYGEEVRGSMISAIEKINDVAEDAVDTVDTFSDGFSAATTAANNAAAAANTAASTADTATANANTATAAAQDATRRADEAAARMGYNAYLDFHEVEGKRYLSVVVPQE